RYIVNINCKEQFEITSSSGGFWSFDLDNREVTFYGGEGEVEQQRNIDADQLEGKCDVIFNSDETAALLINPDSNTIFKVQSVAPVFLDYVKMSRTDLVNEGYDYLELLNVDNLIVVLYEHGILVFDQQLELVSEESFEELMVRPNVEGSQLTYEELNKTIVYGKKGKKRTP
ncbi:hypothetical protein, partial [Zooshikella harenae]